MVAQKNSVVNVADLDVDLYPFLVRYRDGRVERFLRSPFVAASDNPSANRGVATKDVIVDPGTGVSARLFLPSQAAAAAAMGRRRLPVVVYFHGGTFCTESAFGRTYHRYVTSLSASAGALVVSVEYRLAPEHPIPMAYDDAWSALLWVASHADPWLADYADPGRTFLAGDSAGGNIAYRTAVRADDSTIDIMGLIMVHPYFWGPDRLPSEAIWDGTAVFPPYGVDRLWPFVTAGQAGNDDPRINPPDEEMTSLSCRRVLMAVAEKDTLRERGLRVFSGIRDGAWTDGEVTLVDSEGEDHGFHLYSPLRATSRKLMDSIVDLINRPEPLVLGVPTRPFKDPFGYGTNMKHKCTITMAYGATSASSKTGRGNASKANYGVFVRPAARPGKVYNKLGRPPSAVALLPGTHVIMNF